MPKRSLRLQRETPNCKRFLTQRILSLSMPSGTSPWHDGTCIFLQAHPTLWRLKVPFSSPIWRVMGDVS